LGWVDKNRSTDNNSIGQVDILFKIEQRDADIEHGISIIILTAVEFVREISTLVVAVTDEMCWDATTVLTSEVVRRTSCVCYTHTHTWTAPSSRRTASFRMSLHMGKESDAR